MSIASGDGSLPRYFSAALEPIIASEAPPELVAEEFPVKKPMPAYDGLSNPPVGGCAATPGPADTRLHCAQTSSPSWLAYRWYRFVDQPAMAQRAALSDAEKDFLQARVERFHRMLASGGDDASKWIKQRGNAEKLATVDGAQLVTPPEGMEVGYVPVVMYEGTAKPAGCFGSDDGDETIVV